MPKPFGSTDGGKVEILNLIAVGLLAVSLSTFTYFTVNPQIKQVINTFAVKKNPNDIGNPAARKAAGGGNTAPNAVYTGPTTNTPAAPIPCSTGCTSTQIHPQTGTTPNSGTLGSVYTSTGDIAGFYKQGTDAKGNPIYYPIAASAGGPSASQLTQLVQTVAAQPPAGSGQSTTPTTTLNPNNSSLYEMATGNFTSTSDKTVVSGLCSAALGAAKCASNAQLQSYSLGVLKTTDTGLYQQVTAAAAAKNNTAFYSVLTSGNTTANSNPPTTVQQITAQTACVNAGNAKCSTIGDLVTYSNTALKAADATLYAQAQTAIAAKNAAPPAPAPAPAPVPVVPKVPPPVPVIPPTVVVPTTNQNLPQAKTNAQCGVGMIAEGTVCRNTQTGQVIDYSNIIYYNAAIGNINSSLTASDQKFLQDSCTKAGFTGCSISNPVLLEQFALDQLNRTTQKIGTQTLFNQAVSVNAAKDAATKAAAAAAAAATAKASADAAAAQALHNNYVYVAGLLPTQLNGLPSQSSLLKPAYDQCTAAHVSYNCDNLNNLQQFSLQQLQGTADYATAQNNFVANQRLIAQQQQNTTTIPTTIIPAPALTPALTPVSTTGLTGKALTDAVAANAAYQLQQAYKQVAVGSADNAQIALVLSKCQAISPGIGCGNQSGYNPYNLEQFSLIQLQGTTLYQDTQTAFLNNQAYKTAQQNAYAAQQKEQAAAAAEAAQQKINTALANNPAAYNALSLFRQNNGNITLTGDQLNAIAKFCVDSGASDFTGTGCMNVKDFSIAYLNLKPIAAVNPVTGQTVQIPQPNLFPQIAPVNEIPAIAAVIPKNFTYQNPGINTYSACNGNQGCNTTVSYLQAGISAVPVLGPNYINTYKNPNSTFQQKLAASAALGGGLAGAEGLVAAAPAVIYYGGATLLAPTGAAAMAAAEALYPILTSPVTQVVSSGLTAYFVGTTALGVVGGPDSQAYQNAQTLLMQNYLVFPEGAVQMINNTIQTISGTAAFGKYVGGQLINNIFVNPAEIGFAPGLQAPNTINLVWDETLQAYVLPENVTGAVGPTAVSQEIPIASNIATNVSAPRVITNNMLFAPQIGFPNSALSPLSLLASAQTGAQTLFTNLTTGTGLFSTNINAIASLEIAAPLNGNNPIQNISVSQQNLAQAIAGNQGDPLANLNNLNNLPRVGTTQITGTTNLGTGGVPQTPSQSIIQASDPNGALNLQTPALPPANTGNNVPGVPDVVAQVLPPPAQVDTVPQTPVSQNTLAPPTQPTVIQRIGGAVQGLVDQIGTRIQVLLAGNPQPPTNPNEEISLTPSFNRSSNVPNATRSVQGYSANNSNIHSIAIDPNNNELEYYVLENNVLQPGVSVAPNQQFIVNGETYFISIANNGQPQLFRVPQANTTASVTQNPLSPAQPVLTQQTAVDNAIAELDIPEAPPTTTSTSHIDNIANQLSALGVTTGDIQPLNINELADLSALQIRIIQDFQNEGISIYIINHPNLGFNGKTFPAIKALIVNSEVINNNGALTTAVIAHELGHISANVPTDLFPRTSVATGSTAEEIYASQYGVNLLKNKYNVGENDPAIGYLKQKLALDQKRNQDVAYYLTVTLDKLLGRPTMSAQPPIFIETPPSPAQTGNWFENNIVNGRVGNLLFGATVRNTWDTFLLPSQTYTMDQVFVTNQPITENGLTVVRNDIAPPTNNDPYWSRFQQFGYSSYSLDKPLTNAEVIAKIQDPNTHIVLIDTGLVSSSDELTHIGSSFVHALFRNSPDPNNLLVLSVNEPGFDKSALISERVNDVTLSPQSSLEFLNKFNRLMGGLPNERTVVIGHSLGGETVVNLKNLDNVISITPSLTIGVNLPMMILVNLNKFGGFISKNTPLKPVVDATTYIIARIALGDSSGLALPGQVLTHLTEYLHNPRPTSISTTQLIAPNPDLPAGENLPKNIHFVLSNKDLLVDANSTEAWIIRYLESRNIPLSTLNDIITIQTGAGHTSVFTDPSVAQPVVNQTLSLVYPGYSPSPAVQTANVPAVGEVGSHITPTGVSSMIAGAAAAIERARPGLLAQVQDLYARSGIENVWNGIRSIFPSGAATIPVSSTIDIGGLKGFFLTDYEGTGVLVDPLTNATYLVPENSGGAKELIHLGQVVTVHGIQIRYIGLGPDGFPQFTSAIEPAPAPAASNIIGPTKIPQPGAGLLPQLKTDQTEILRGYLLPNPNLAEQNPEQYLGLINLVAKQNGIVIKPLSQLPVEFTIRVPQSGIFDDTLTYTVYVPNPNSLDPLDLENLARKVVDGLNAEYNPSMPVDVRDYQAEVATTDLTRAGLDPQSLLTQETPISLTSELLPTPAMQAEVDAIKKAIENSSRDQIARIILNLKTEATQDVITGIDNKAGLLKDLNVYFKDAQKSGTPLSIVVLDLDNFKDVNDTYGHIIGDEVLAALANFLKSGIRDSDTVGRWGGDEFILILRGANQNVAKNLMEILVNKFDNQINLARTNDPIKLAKMSYGIEEWNKSDTANNLIARADQKMYAAKNAKAAAQPAGVVPAAAVQPVARPAQPFSLAQAARGFVNGVTGVLDTLGSVVASRPRALSLVTNGIIIISTISRLFNPLQPILPTQIAFNPPAIIQTVPALGQPNITGAIQPAQQGQPATTSIHLETTYPELTNVGVNLSVPESLAPTQDQKAIAFVTKVVNDYAQSHPLKPGQNITQEMGDSLAQYIKDQIAQSSYSKILNNKLVFPGKVVTFDDILKGVSSNYGIRLQTINPPIDVVENMQCVIGTTLLQMIAPELGMPNIQGLQITTANGIYFNYADKFSEGGQYNQKIFGNVPMKQYVAQHPNQKFMFYIDGATVAFHYTTLHDVLRGSVFEYGGGSGHMGTITGVYTDSQGNYYYTIAETNAPAEINFPADKPNGVPTYYSVDEEAFMKLIGVSNTVFLLPKSRMNELPSPEPIPADLLTAIKNGGAFIAPAANINNSPILFGTNYNPLPETNKLIKQVTPTEIIVHWDGQGGDPAKWNTNITYNGLSEVRVDPQTGLKRTSDSHFGVDQNSVVQFLPMGAQTVQFSYGASGYPNAINIEMAGIDFIANPDGTTNVPAAEVDNTVNLIIKLMKQYNIPASSVFGHYEQNANKNITFTMGPNGQPTDITVTDGNGAANDGKIDPGVGFMNYIRNLVKERLAANGSIQASGSLDQAAVQFQSSTLADSTKIAASIGFGDDPGNNLCGPISETILVNAGILPANTPIHDFYYLKLPDELYKVNRIFDPNKFTQLNFLNSGYNLANYPWQKDPPRLGDWFYTNGDFDHMFVITRVTSDGLIYARMNYVDTNLSPNIRKPFWNPIGEQLVLNLNDPNDPNAMFTRWSNAKYDVQYGSTGKGGFLIERPNFTVTSFASNPQQGQVVPIPPSTTTQVQLPASVQVIESAAKEAIANPRQGGISMGEIGNYTIKHQPLHRDFTQEIYDKLIAAVFAKSPPAVYGFATNEGPKGGLATLLQVQKDMLQMMQRGYVTYGNLGIQADGQLMTSQKSPEYQKLAPLDASGNPTPVTYDQLTQQQKNIYDFKKSDLVPVDEQFGKDPIEALASGKVVAIIAGKPNDLGRKVFIYQYNPKTGELTFVGIGFIGDTAKISDYSGQPELGGDFTQGTGDQFYNVPLGFEVSNGTHTGTIDNVPDGIPWIADFPSAVYTKLEVPYTSPLMNIVLVDTTSLPATPMTVINDGGKITITAPKSPVVKDENLPANPAASQNNSILSWAEQASRDISNWINGIFHPGAQNTPPVNPSTNRPLNELPDVTSPIQNLPAANPQSGSAVPPISTLTPAERAALGQSIKTAAEDKMATCNQGYGSFWNRCGGEMYNNKRLADGKPGAIITDWKKKLKNTDQLFWCTQLVVAAAEKAGIAIAHNFLVQNTPNNPRTPQEVGMYDDFQDRNLIIDASGITADNITDKVQAGMVAFVKKSASGYYVHVGIVQEVKVDHVVDANGAMSTLVKVTIVQANAGLITDTYELDKNGRLALYMGQDPKTGKNIIYYIGAFGDLMDYGK
jgi:diguanylate cyclase (GGDEF)-like protein